jgi:predicted transcriptional regulator
MARAPRSNKQPAFDPSELTDLIFTPAVGTGVGSHLVGAPNNFPEIVPIERWRNKADLSAVEETATSSISPAPATQLTTVDMSETAATKTDVSTVDITFGEDSIKRHEINDLADVSTVDNTAISTDTDIFDETGRAALQTIRQPDLSTVDVKPQTSAFWVSEKGDLIPEARIKRIHLAQDVINSTEEAVYDTLWNSRSAARTDERDSIRLVQAGYDYLAKRTRLSKRTIQRIIEKLIEKDFIAIESPADIYQRSSTLYRVFSYRTVLDRHIQKGRSHVAKMGPGFSYVRPVDDPRRPSVPVDFQPENSDINNMSTVDILSTVTVDRSNLSTVVPLATIYIGSNTLGKEVSEASSSSAAVVCLALNRYGAADDDVVDRLIQSCRQQSPDCTEEEIIHFIDEKGALVKVRDNRIHNPIGFLLTAVPKCFTGEAFQLYREEEKRRRAAEEASEVKRDAELDEWRKEQKARLEDPEVSEDDKQFIRECLRIV